MTQEEKQLLQKDLSARLPYGVKVKYIFDDSSHCPFELSTKILQECLDKGFLPYLRPMSSMTEEEENEYRAINCYEGLFPCNEDALDYILSHHFDYRGLIEKSLAIVAPEGMYKTE